MRVDPKIEAKVIDAITARERRRAVEERHTAAAAHEAAITPAPSSTAWDIEPERGSKGRERRKLRTPSTIDEKRQHAALAAKAAWARRSPDAAAQQRALRKTRAEAIEAFKHKNQGTVETHAHAQAAAERHNAGALARLLASGAIDKEQLAWAVEIATVAEHIGADVAIKTQRYEMRVDGSGGGGDRIETLRQVRSEAAYTAWRRAVGHPSFGGPVATVLDMIVGETAGFTVVARRYNMGARRTKRLLIDALNLWPAMYADARRMVTRAA